MSADHAVAFAGRGFELSLAPLIRLALFRLADDEHELLWSHHHILLDGWSLPLVLEEIITAYERADLTFEMCMQVRNKVISAYQEIMKMQV